MQLVVLQIKVESRLRIKVVKNELYTVVNRAVVNAVTAKVSCYLQLTRGGGGALLTLQLQVRWEGGDTRSQSPGHE